MSYTRLKFEAKVIQEHTAKVNRGFLSLQYV